MSSNILLVDYDFLDRAITRLVHQTDALEALHQRIASVSADLDDGWDGVAAAAFQSELSAGVLPVVQRMSQALTVCAWSIRDAIDTYGDAERRAGDLFKSGSYAEPEGSGITSVHSIAIDEPGHPLNPATPANRMLPPGWSLAITRSGDQTDLVLRDQNGAIVPMPAGTHTSDFLTGLRTVLGRGIGLAGENVSETIDTFKDLAAGNYQQVIDTTRGIEYMRSFKGWQKFADRLGVIGALVNGAQIIYDGIQLLDGNLEHIETTSLMTLPDGTQIVYDKVIDEDGKLLADSAGILGGWAGAKGGAALGGAVGALVGPLGAVIGVVVGGIGGGLGLGYLAEKLVKDNYDGSKIDVDTKRTQLYPQTDLVITNGTLIDTGAGSRRIDIGRLLQGDGSVTLKAQGTEIVIER